MLSDPAPRSGLNALYFLLNFVQSFAPTFKQRKNDYSSVKTIHRNGAFAKVSVKWEGNQSYTGMFSSDYDKGKLNCLLRLSTPLGFGDHSAPSVGIKCPRHGFLEDADMLLIGEPFGDDKARNMFDAPVWNHAERPLLSTKSNFGERMIAVESRAQIGSSYVSMLGLSNFAEYGVSPHCHERFMPGPRFPFAIKMVPTIEARDEYQELMWSFPLETNPAILLPKMELEKGSKIYKIYASPAPTEGFVLIGSVYLESEFVSSTYDRDRLFFTHQRFEEDLEFYPEWEKYLTHEYQRECHSMH